MGFILLLVILAVLVRLVTYIVRKNRVKSKRTILTLTLIALALIATFVWYLTPFKLVVPLNAIIKITYGGDIDYDEGMKVITVSDQNESQNIIQKLNALWLKRTLTGVRGQFRDGLIVRADDYFSIQVLIPPETAGGTPERWGEYYFIISSPEFSTFVHPRDDGRNKLNVQNAENAQDIVSLCTAYF